MTNTYFQVPRLSTSFQTKLQAYAEAMKLWNVQYGADREEADGIQWEGSYGERNTANWSELPEIKRHYR